MAFQPQTLRRVVKQPRWGFNRSAARTQRKPSPNLDEENFTRASGGPQGQAKKGTSNVVRIGDRSRQTSAGPRASWASTHTLSARSGCRVSPLSVCVDPQTPGADRTRSRYASRSIRAAKPLAWRSSTMPPGRWCGPQTSPIAEYRCVLASSPGARSAKVVASGIPAIGHRAGAIAVTEKGWLAPSLISQTPERAHLGGASAPLLPGWGNLVGAGAL